MAELIASKKNKINLTDYPYQKDIENRLLMSSFSLLDKAVMEELLFSPLQISIQKFSKNLGEKESDIRPILEKFEKTGLLKIEADSVVVDKETRKYFELQFTKVEDDFKPDMEFLQALLRKVPIEFLPSWYSIPRTSNNIFASIVEKYLVTPQVFQRYLLEIDLPDPILAGMAQDVFKSENLKVYAKDLMKKYGLSKEKFEEYMLRLEFALSCCVAYEKEGPFWTQVVTPFHEWREYLLFIKESNTFKSLESSKVIPCRPSPSAFIQDMTAILESILKTPLTLNESGFLLLLSKCKGADREYIEKVLKKLILLNLASIQESLLSIQESAYEWLGLREENKSIFIYRHPLNKISSSTFSSYLLQEKAVREAEKTIARVVYKGWVLFDDFIKGVIAPLSEQNVVALKKIGKSWRYQLPEYTPEEIAFVKAIIFEWLFEAGITSIGTYEGKDSFCVTPFGQSLFG